MFGPITRRGFLAAGALLLTWPTFAPAQETPFRTVDPLDLSLDRAGVFTLHFAYVPPRIATVEVREREGGPLVKKVVWYMPYYVYNKTGKPRTIVPEFELVTKDPNGVLANFLDEPQPAVLDALRKIEDPTGELKLQSSIGISKTPIPETNADSVPRAVYGVAVWLDVPDKAPDVNNFSVYVSGLSDGLSAKETDDGKVIVSKKTLQLDFRRPTDAFKNKADDIKVNDNNGLGSERWQYRESTVKEKK
jgi:hypothetical protein